MWCCARAEVLTALPRGACASRWANDAKGGKAKAAGKATGHRRTSLDDFIVDSDEEEDEHEEEEDDDDGDEGSQAEEGTVSRCCLRWRVSDGTCRSRSCMCA